MEYHNHDLIATLAFIAKIMDGVLVAGDDKPVAFGFIWIQDRLQLVY